MITLYTGTPGSGKTLHAVGRIWVNLKRGNAVLTNIALNADELGDRRDYYRYLPAVTPADLVQFSADFFGGSRPRENGILLVLDECQLIFSNRDWRTNSALGWVSLFSQHRKLGYDVILITQYDRMIDKQVRTLVEYESKHRRLDRLPWPWSWIMRLLKGGAFYVRKGWYPLRGQKIDEEIVRVSRKVLRLYNTYDTYGGLQEIVSKPALQGQVAEPVIPAGKSDSLSDIIRRSACFDGASGARPRSGTGGDRGRVGTGGVPDGVRDISVCGGGRAVDGGVDAG